MLPDINGLEQFKHVRQIGQMILVGVQLSSLTGDWIFGA